MANGIKALSPSSFGVRGVVGKEAVAKKPNRVSAKCAIPTRRKPIVLALALVAIDKYRWLSKDWCGGALCEIRLATGTQVTRTAFSIPGDISEISDWPGDRQTKAAESGTAVHVR
jgi:hypothetical protein